MIGHRCRNCLWWDNEHDRVGTLRDEGFGYCRKHKPLVYGKDSRHYGGWPLVDRADFCGEFREDKE